MRRSSYRNRHRIHDSDFEAGRLILKALFAQLRKDGLFAKQSFMCCMGCACAAIGDAATANPGKYRGAFYYHKQDAEMLREKGETYFGFGALNEKGEPGTEAETLKIGREIEKLAVALGLKVTWDGDAHTRMKMRFPGLYPS
jgi:hypothetical protein